MSWLFLKGLPRPDEDRKGVMVRVQMHKTTKAFKVLAHGSVELESLRAEKSGIPED